jgi:anaphase-promoting complex subunit 6
MFQLALKLDVFCYAAFDALVQHQMLSADEERDLLRSMPFKVPGVHTCV